jgi:hypothetical protein
MNAVPKSNLPAVQNPTLSAAQRSSLESTFTCFRGMTAFLDSIDTPLQADEKQMARGLCLLAELCEHKLVESFPELHVWLAEWGR